MARRRQHVPTEARNAVLIEAGYRCANPACRSIIALDLHHLVSVRSGGGNNPSNLLALCPNCHALYERGTISREAIATWKQALIVLNAALDQRALDLLLFLDRLESSPEPEPQFTADGAVAFAPLLSAGLAELQLRQSLRSGSAQPYTIYRLILTSKGRALVDAWRGGDLGKWRAALDSPGRTDHEAANA